MTDAGLFIIPMAVTMLFASPLAGRLGALGFVVLAVAHDSPWPVYVANGVLGIGVGLAFASLANLVVSAVEPAQTGEATGINTIMRTIGGTLGAQIASTIVASSAGGSGYPTAFWLSAAALGVAALSALAGPSARPRTAVEIPA
ncbi:hypothetical protein [Actinophytocola sp.]|uniref:hypothetical protein n=1 Tax=Actinophytocola sp. TaxID=1872138 RepID=UPI0025BF2932|nr:hypothetical protein [Actinophytocola sp.]